MSEAAARRSVLTLRHVLTSRSALLLLALLPILTATWFLSAWEKPKIWKVAFSPDGKQLATLSAMDRASVAWLTLWRLSTQKPTVRIEQRGGIGDFAFSSDGKLVATSGQDGTVHLWDTSTGKLRATLDAGLSVVHSLHFAADSQTLRFSADSRMLVINDKHEAQLWDVSKRRVVDRLADDNLLGSMAVARDGRTLAIEVLRPDLKTREVELYDISSGRFSLLRALPNSSGSPEFSPDGTRLAVRSNGLLKLWDLSKNQAMKKIAPWSAGVAFTPDGKRLANVTPGALTVWDLSSERMVGRVPASNGLTWSVHFSPDGRLLTGVTSDNRAEIRSAATGQQLAVFPKPQRVPPIYFALAALLLAFLLWSVAWVRCGLRGQLRRWQPLVDVALLNAIVLAGLMARVLRIGFQDELGRPTLLFAVAQVAALLSLVIAWMVFGGGRWSLRLPAALVGLAGVATIPLVVWGASDWRVWEMCIGAVSLLVSLFVVLSLCRFFGMRIVAKQADASQQEPDPRGHAQFPLKDLVLTTGAAAVLFAVARLAAPTPLPLEIVVFIAIEGACLACIAALAAWAALGTARWPIRVVALAITAAALGSIHELFFKTSIPLDLPWWWLASIPALAGGFVAASLCVVRAHGYRMLFHRRARPPAIEPSCSESYASSPSLGHPLTR